MFDIVVGFSPRTWRCFLTKQQIRETESGFLHARGGVSKHDDAPDALTGFSPRTWRCFLVWEMIPDDSVVFSTHVEVFPGRALFSLLMLRFLHARGGVSHLVP